MDSILGNTLSAISHALGLGMMETSLLLGAVLLFTIYKIIDLS
jgi:mannose/fructose/N-acetylgalactosamine-specific phosphotransferase system component IID